MTLSLKLFTDKLEFLHRRQTCYERVFDVNKPEVKVILADLRKICPNDPTTNAGRPIEDRQVYINIGRLQVLNHILSAINMTSEQINAIAREESKK